VKNLTNQIIIKKTVRWLLLILIVLYLISGFGITEFRTVEALTLGLLTKSLAFKIHDVLWIPFLVLLLSHISLSSFFKLYAKVR
jgi:hypothetical protein